jgi:hypothetical protein
MQMMSVPQRTHSYELIRPVTGITLLFYVWMMFVPHRTHICEFLRSVTEIALLFSFRTGALLQTSDVYELQGTRSQCIITHHKVHSRWVSIRFPVGVKDLHISTAFRSSLDPSNLVSSGSYGYRCPLSSNELQD